MGIAERSARDRRYIKRQRLGGFDGVNRVATADAVMNGDMSSACVEFFRAGSVVWRISSRPVSGTPAAGKNSNSGLSLCWSYDFFGNRTAQSQQSVACSPPTMAQFASTWAYSGNNQVSGVIPPGGGPVSPSPYTYDPSGDGDIIADMTTGNQ